MAKIGEAITSQSTAMEKQNRQFSGMLLGLAKGTQTELVKLEERTQRQLARVERDFADMVNQSNAHLITIDERLTKLNESAWEISGYLKAQMDREDFRGDQAFVLHTIDATLDDLQRLGMHFLPYQLHKLNQLLLIADTRNLSVHNFKNLGFEEMKEAKRILQRLEDNQEQCVANLESIEGGGKALEEFEKLLDAVTSFEQDKEQLESKIRGLGLKFTQVSVSLEHLEHEITRIDRALVGLRMPSGQSAVLFQIDLQIDLLQRYLGQHDSQYSGRTVEQESPRIKFERALLEAEENRRSMQRSRDEKLMKMEVDKKTLESSLTDRIAEKSRVSAELDHHKHMLEMRQAQHSEDIKKLTPMFPESFSPSEILNHFDSTTWEGES